MSSKDRNAQIFVAKLAPSIDERELDYQFSKYGRIRNIRLMRGYAFVEYEDYRDAEDAIYAMDGKRIEGQRIVVQKARGKQRDRNRRDSRSPNRTRPRRPGPQETDVCYNCGKQGHWANECREPKKPKGKYFRDRDGNRRSKSRDSKRDNSFSGENRSRSRSRSRSSSKSVSKERDHKDEIKENEVKDTTKDENKPVEQDVLLNKDVETNKVVNDTTTTNIDKPEHEKEENA